MIIEWLEFPSASFIEPAEHLIVFQTQHLYAHDQAFQSAYDNIAYDDPIQFELPSCAPDSISTTSMIAA